MALTQTLANMRTNVRRLADAGGTTALMRHPDADLNDYINRGLGSIYRKLTEAVPDQKYLATQSITTVAGTATYALSSDFMDLISVDCTANGVKVWLVAYEMHERPGLTDPAVSYEGVPFTYRLRGANIELLPTPQGAYTVNLWYVPNLATLTLDANTFDTVSRLDDYIVAYAARFVAIRDKNWDLAGACQNICAELTDEIHAIGRNRDRNSPTRIVDEGHADRWGRRRYK